ncbi:hypothetical protein H671_3g9455 [Cricetulus griseus]|uniref:Uncharacterized protein n=2 Tax=Cricetulus griseus TaxID=10029 RepID=A0A061IA80_CRIGR|nr:hypothetical protein H671_3g9455 [Cricetulus griseus]
MYGQLASDYTTKENDFPSSGNPFTVNSSSRIGEWTPRLHCILATAENAAMQMIYRHLFNCLNLNLPSFAVLSIDQTNVLAIVLLRPFEFSLHSLDLSDNYT